MRDKFIFFANSVLVTSEADRRLNNNILSSPMVTVNENIDNALNAEGNSQNQRSANEVQRLFNSACIQIFPQCLWISQKRFCKHVTEEVCSLEIVCLD